MGGSTLIPELLQYTFMQKALIVGLVIALITPLIGQTVVLKRLSMIGDSLSHSSLAGVAAGLVIGINPVLGAIVFSVIAAFAIERVRKVFKSYSELAIAIIMSTGIGLAGILSGFIKNSTDFNSFLFGSIVATSNYEVIFICILGILTVATVILLYRELMYIAFDEECAGLAGIPVSVINFLFTILTAVTVSVSARTVGTLVVSSLLVLPVASAMQVSKSYKGNTVASIIYAVIATMTGLIVSFYGDLRPGGTIVIISVIMLIFSIAYKRIFQKV